MMCIWILAPTDILESTRRILVSSCSKVVSQVRWEERLGEKLCSFVVCVCFACSVSSEIFGYKNRAISTKNLFFYISFALVQKMKWPTPNLSLWTHLVGRGMKLLLFLVDYGSSWPKQKSLRLEYKLGRMGKYLVRSVLRACLYPPGRFTLLKASKGNLELPSVLSCDQAFLLSGP